MNIKMIDALKAAKDLLDQAVSYAGDDDLCDELEKMGADLVGFLESQQAEIDALKQQNADLESKYAARGEALDFLNGARQEWYEMYMQKREAIACFKAGLIRAGAKVPIDAMTMNAHEQGLSIALVCLDSELKRTAKLKFDLDSLTEREAIDRERGDL